VICFKFSDVGHFSGDLALGVLFCQVNHLWVHTVVIYDCKMPTENVICFCWD